VIAESGSGSGVLVNSVNPGWVRTDMGGKHAPLSVQQGADTIVWAATLPDNGLSGAFLSNRRAIAW
jgi:NAD(P)-dependent dehydrogenase (short-subunit alcohol dehydrogenase family)